MASIPKRVTTRCRALLAALLLLAAAVLYPGQAHARPGDNLTIYALTFGPGDHPFFKFGHNAIWVHDSRARRPDAIYNYGTFAFTGPALIPTFLKGKMQYWLSVQSMPRTKLIYQRENRSIVAQELNLSGKQKRQLVRFLRKNAQPKNKFYKYDYYRDNCSTRVRDAIDSVIDGSIKKYSQGPAGMSWRDHTRRLVADDFPVYLGLHLALGGFIDKPISLWEEMFLPAVLQDTLRKVKIKGPDGKEVPLVTSEKTLISAKRDPMRSAPPNWLLQMALLGLVIGGGFAATGKFAPRSTAARAVFGVTLALMSFVLGFFGLVMCLLWTTDHVVAHHNENILQLFPLCWGFVWYGVSLAKGKAQKVGRVLLLAQVCLGASVAGFVLQVLPMFNQQNGEIIALAMPIWAGVFGGLFLWNKELSGALASASAQTQPESGSDAKAAKGNGDETDAENVDDAEAAGAGLGVAALTSELPFEAHHRLACQKHVRLRWLGTAGFELVSEDHHLLIDPYLSRPSFGECLFRPLLSKEGLLKQVIARADAIVVGHSHFDHILDVPSLAHQTGARVLGSRSAIELCRNAQLPEAQLVNVQGVTVSEVYEEEVGPFRLRLVPSVHSKFVAGRVPFVGEISDCDQLPLRTHRYRCGAVFSAEIRVGGLCFYHLGSADLLDELAPKGVDVLLMCVAGHTSTPRFAERVLSRLQPQAILLSHWDNLFLPLAQGPRELPAIGIRPLVEEFLRLEPQLQIGAIPYLQPISFG